MARHVFNRVAFGSFGMVIAMLVCGPQSASADPLGMTYQSIYSFDTGSGGNTPDISPVYVYDSDDATNIYATLYGVTKYGGSDGNGVLYSLGITINKSSNSVTAGTYSVLHDFSGGSAGCRPQGIVYDSTNDRIYGVTQWTTVSSDRAGTVYRYDVGSDTFTRIYTFTDNGTTDAIGDRPYGIALDGTGTLYGTTAFGGSNDYGTVWKLTNITTATEDGATHATLHSFTGSGTGRTPYGTVTLDLGNDAIYGVASAGGAGDDGTLWVLDTTDNGVSVLKDFGTSGDGGKAPYDAPLLVGGVLYGTTHGELGNSADEGTLWKYVLSGSTYTQLLDFDASTGDGGKPIGSLLLGVSDGTNPVRIWGATAGTNLWDGSEDGTIFSIDYTVDDTVMDIENTFTGGEAPTRTPFFVDPGAGHNVRMFGTTWDGGTNSVGQIYTGIAPEPTTMFLMVAGAVCLLRRNREWRV